MKFWTTTIAITPLLLSLSQITLQASEQQQKNNILLICVDDLRPELSCYGKTYIHSPNIDQLAKQGTLFTHHYVQAPTCGASRYALLTGTYGPASNNALMDLSKKLNKKNAPPNQSMPAWFKQHGYTTCSIGKVSHHPGGLGGADWNDPKQVEMPQSWDHSLMPCGQWKHPRGAMHGLANGEIRKNPATMDVFQASDGEDTVYPDGLITLTAKQQLKNLTGKQKPFFLAVGFIRPHLPLGAPAQYLELYKDTKLPAIPHPNKPKGISTWHESAEFLRYNHWGRDPRKDSDFADQVRRHYASCVSYADAQIGEILRTLKETGADKNTIVVLWGDHGWHLGEHAIWGKHSLFEESLHAPLIIATPSKSLSSTPSNAVAETVDIFPTLCALTHIPTPKTLQGESLTSISKREQFAVSYNNRAATIRTATHRLVAHKNGALELYDFTAKDKGALNCASQHSDLAKSLREELKSRLPRFHFK